MNILFLIFCKKVWNDTHYQHRKKRYILKNIISQMVDSQIFMYDALCKWKDIDTFLAKLKEYPEAYQYSLNYIETLNGNCWLILNYYQHKLKSNDLTPIVIPGVRETLNDLTENRLSKRCKTKLKKIIKKVIPHKILVIYRQRKK